MSDEDGKPRGSDPPAAPPRQGLWYAALAVGLAGLAVAGYAGYVLYPRFELSAAQGAGLLVLAAGAGVASFFSPCAFPLLVTLLARETGAEPGTPSRAPLGRALTFATALSAGAAAFLLLAGVALGLGGGALFGGVTFTSTAGMAIRATVGSVLILLGLVQLGVLRDRMPALGSVARPFLSRQAKIRRTHPAAGFALFGFAYLLAGFG